MGPAPLPDCGDTGPPPAPAVARPDTDSLQSTFTSSNISSNMADNGNDIKNQQLQLLKTELQKHVEKPLVKGDAWYLVDNHWFKQLKKYVGLEGANYDSGGSAEAGDENANPGPIDNKPLFKEDGTEIRDHMIDELDYALMPEEAWTLVLDKFGLVEGQEPIKRKVVEHGMFVKHCKVEVYFIEFQLAENSNLEETKKKKFSKSDTLETIQNAMRSEFNIAADADTRLWNKYSSNTYEQLSRLDNTVQDAGLFSGQMIIIEVKNEDGTWPRQTRSSTVTNGSTSPIPAPPPAPLTNGDKEASPVTSSSGASTSKYNFSSGYGDGGMSDKAQPGICGLSNLGNTCFMNSIIQGLSNTPAITEYFDNDNYLEDINEDNPLGMKGEIARTFGQLIKDMWSGKYNYVVPRAFKMAVGRFAPQFSGYQQQDSQELLTFLLDGLHEDLNRVKQKPYVEMSDSDGKPDSVVAMEAWSNYKKRNDSVILDIFHGLLKSTVVCPECPKVSVTFDPTCYLSLPLPVKKERQVELFLVHLDPSKPPTQYKVTCPKNGNMGELCLALAKLADISAEGLIVTDVYSHRFHKIYSNDDQISQIMDRDDIFVYETDTTDPGLVTVPVYLREKKTGSSYAPTNLFGQPLLVSLPKSTTVASLYEALLVRMSRYVTRPDPEDEWWKPPPKTESGPESMEQGGSSEESPSSETEPAKTSTVTDDDDMLSDEEEEVGPVKLFSLHLVNSYGNAQIEPIDSTADESSVSLNAKNYLSLDWHPRAKSKFFEEKKAEDFNQDDSWHGKATPKKQTINLSECLKLYTSQEKLGADDAWYCPNCQKHQQATKKFDLWSLPEMLVIHLKRFSYNRYWRDKIDTVIEFPINNLDMTPYVINSDHGKAVYDLISVSNHYGGMGGGHYTAYGKNKTDGNWYYFDDSSVTQTNEEAVVTKAAYVLFYQRRTLPKSKRNIPAAAGSADEATTSTAGCCNGVNGNGPTNGVSGESDEDMEVN